MLLSSDLYSLPDHAHSPEFEARAMALFAAQFEENEWYGKWCRLLNRTPENTHKVEHIPFLPVQFFKNAQLKTGQWEHEAVFTSSTTTGGVPSQHYCPDLNGYLHHTVKGFERHYGPIIQWVILALLPSYLERSGSSLVAMAEHWVQQSGHPESGFYLYDHDALLQQLQRLQAKGQPTLLLGVTFALLDLAEQLQHAPFNMPELRIMETGGMKGRRRELIREEVHEHLRQAFPQSPIDSEYGMTELFSQAYLQNSGTFDPPPWMRVYTRSISDPLAPLQRNGQRGALNIIDLANEKTVAFLALADQGRVFENGQFEIYGRLDHSEIRGCNLMISL